MISLNMYLLFMLSVLTLLAVNRIKEDRPTFYKYLYFTVFMIELFIYVVNKPYVVFPPNLY